MPGPGRACAAVPLGRPTRSRSATTSSPASTRPPRRSIRPSAARLLTFTVIGGGFAGLEVLGELEDMTRRAARHQPGFVAEEIRLGAPRGGRPDHARGQAEARRARARPARSAAASRSASAPALSARGRARRARRRHDVRHRHIVVAAGSVPNPLLERTDLPLDARGRVRCSTTLQVRDRAHVFTAGDCAAVPDVTAGPARRRPVATTAPNAQHAVRQARLLARNVDALLRGRLLRATGTATPGRSPASDDAGVPRRSGRCASPAGRPALLHRAYHLWAMPTADRTVRIALDWLVTAVMGRDLVAVGRRDAPPAPDADAPPTVAPRVDEAEIGDSRPRPPPAGTPTWGVEPPAPATGPLPVVVPCPALPRAPPTRRACRRGRSPRRSPARSRCPTRRRSARPR